MIVNTSITLRALTLNGDSPLRSEGAKERKEKANHSKKSKEKRDLIRSRYLR
ncbi:MAG: hypothetical protein ACMUEL_00475 [Flavobacteriales bacterium Tduv]